MRKIKIFTFFVFLLLIILSCNQKSNNANLPLPQFLPDSVGLKHDTLLTGLDQPWGITFLPDGSLLITEKKGVLTMLKDGLKTNITGLPAIRSTGQGGLMDITLHPDYKNNGWIYFSATTDINSGFSTALFRARLNGNQLVSVQKLFQSNQISTSSVHFGSRIVFDNNKFLYLCLGERNNTMLAQSLESHAGKVIRIKDDGLIPDDNPFYQTTGALKDIWSYGHRNPQGMVKHPITGEIWLNEHGPKGGDEINLLQKGANYAWPLATFGINYDGTPVSNDTAYEATLQPVHYWVPSIAPCGLEIYYSDSIPQWKGKLFTGALAGRHINITEIKGNKFVKEQRILQNYARFRCVKQGADGYLYFLTESPGLLCRFKPMH